jgi:transposase
MLCWEEFVELRNLRERGWSVSAIARHLGKDRKTVRRYLTDPLHHHLADLLDQLAGKQPALSDLG